MTLRIAIMTMLGCLSLVVHGALLHVAPSGNDANPGATTAPLASLAAARDAVRALRSAGEKGDIDVILQDGIYALDETLVFGVEDSAPAGSMTRYRAAEGATPLVSGGRVITGWEKSTLQGRNVWMAKVPWAQGDAFFHCLYDGKTLLRFRFARAEVGYRAHATGVGGEDGHDPGALPEAVFDRDAVGRSAWTGSPSGPETDVGAPRKAKKKRKK